MNLMTEKEYKKGTTTVGLICVDGVVLAADKRASVGHLAMHKKVEKILKVTKNIAMVIAGIVSDAQKLHGYLKAEMELYRLDKAEEPNIDIAATLMSNILYEGRKSIFPYLVGLLLAGVTDEGKFKVYSLEVSGSSIHDDYVCWGSGMELAYGVLQEGYKKGMSTQAGLLLAAKAINSALQRDVYTGDGIDVAVIDKDGFRKIAEDKITALLKKKKAA